MVDQRWVDKIGDIHPIGPGRSVEPLAVAHHAVARGVKQGQTAVVGAADRSVC